MMTRKDYIRFADMCVTLKDNYDDFQFACLLHELCLLFNNDNPRFKEKRFIDYINGKLKERGK
jgi:hypothetical protein